MTAQTIRRQSLHRTCTGAATADTLAACCRCCSRCCCMVRRSRLNVRSCAGAVVALRRPLSCSPAALRSSPLGADRAARLAAAVAALLAATAVLPNALVSMGSS